MARLSRPVCVRVGRGRAVGGGRNCSTSHNTCELLLVADEQFFKEVGSASVPQTVRILVSRLISSLTDSGVVSGTTVRALVLGRFSQKKIK